jgi:hypothetical protein
MADGAIMLLALSLIVILPLGYRWAKRVEAMSLAADGGKLQREADAGRIWREMQAHNRESKEWAAWYESTKTPRPQDPARFWQPEQEVTADRRTKIVLRPGNADASFMDR